MTNTQTWLSGLIAGVQRGLVRLLKRDGMIWPRKPDIPKASLTELERVGPAGIRDRLSQSNETLLYATHGPKREEALRWLDWKAAVGDMWVKAGVGLAFVAAVAGVIAAIEGWPASK